MGKLVEGQLMSIRSSYKVFSANEELKGIFKANWNYHSLLLGPIDIEKRILNDKGQRVITYTAHKLHLVKAMITVTP